MVPRLNDGSQDPPRLRTDLHMFNLWELPEWSTAPRHEDHRELYAALKEAGYQGLQCADPAICAEVGLGCTALSRVNEPGDAEAVAKPLQDAGNEAVVLHVGWGLEDDDKAHRLLEDIVSTAAKLDFPILVETHRTTIFQDMWRTVGFIRAFPEVRINGDYSHWYTGAEMTNGGIEPKWEFMAPVFERVHALHGRIGNPSQMQVDVGDGTVGENVAHFREMWTRSFIGFLRQAKPGDYIPFMPELLPPSIHYGRAFRNASGEMAEECDRWQQAMVLTAIAREAFLAAEDIVARQQHAAED